MKCGRRIENCIYQMLRRAFGDLARDNMKKCNFLRKGEESKVKWIKKIILNGIIDD